MRYAVDEERAGERVKLETAVPLLQDPDLKRRLADLLGVVQQRRRQLAVEHGRDRERGEPGTHVLAERLEHLLGEEPVERVGHLGIAVDLRVESRLRER